MAKILKFKRGNTTKNNSYIGSDGEITINTTKKTVVVHDGITSGGSTLATEQSASNPSNIVQDSTHRFVTDSDKTNWNGKINATEKAIANGVATLDSNGKVVLSQIPDSAFGQLEYQGVYDFSIGMPTATRKGQYWIASVSGNGYTIGDWAAWNGSAFDKIDNTDAVSSVAGRTGNVVLTKSDVGLNNVDNTADNTKNVLSSTKLTTVRSLAISGDITWTVNFDGSANVTAAGTLATVADNGTGTFKKITVDTKGRVTGTQSVVQTDITGLLGSGSITNTMLYNSAVANLSGTNTGDETISTIKTKLGITTLSGSNTGDQTITLTGDVTGSGMGSFAATLVNSGVTAGTYKSVTVNSKGIITAGTNPTTLLGYGITDADTSAQVTTKVNNAVSTAVSGLVNSAPGLLDTLDELANALGDDPNFATTVANNIATKVTKNADIVAGTGTKVTYDAKGLVTSSTTPTTLAGYSISDAYTKTEVNNSLALKVDDSEIASVNLLRADKYLAAQNVANMSYDGNGKLSKVQYNNSTDVDYEVLTYNVDGKLSNVAHYTTSTLRGNTVLSYSAGKLVSAIYTGV